MSLKTYRTDIDGIRAFSVISVIFFHLGFLKNGFLGVDVFFVISGFLITGIVYTEVLNNKFSVLKFYERRLRRIFPLVLFTSLLSFLIGFSVMLPDDFENLCQSIIASNFSANNMLMYITSSNYWDVKNDFKPMMHTWSLGVEEQFYIVFPFLIFLFSGKYRRFILPLLILLSLFSVLLFLFSNDVAQKFYFIHYRFYELSFGGILSILSVNESKVLKFVKWDFNLVLLIVLLILIFFDFGLGNNFLVILTTLVSGLMLLSGGMFANANTIYNKVLTNKFIAFIGKISFSLYMWHQIVFAFARYLVFEEIAIFQACVLILLTFCLSVITYYSIENTFRNRQLFSTKRLLVIISVLFVSVNLISFYYYAIGGVVRDVPELNILKNSALREINFFSSEDNIHIRYNESARRFKGEFSNDTTKLKVLVLGDSFGRDLVNLLNESSFRDRIEIKYVELWSDNDAKSKKNNNSQIIFLAALAEIPKLSFSNLCNYHFIDSNKVYYFGVKDFGVSNGIYYAKIRSGSDCQDLKTKMKLGVYELNEKLTNDWGNRYVNIIPLLIDAYEQVPVFTDSCKFISQDTKHLTQPGAMFLAKRFDNLLANLLGIQK